jgi:HSP20 family protein
VAETKDAFEVTAELPGVDEKDIKVSLDNNQLVISGEKKAESTKEEKDWHVEERSSAHSTVRCPCHSSRKMEP